MTFVDEPATGGEWRRILVRLMLTLVVLGAGYAGLAVYLGRHVPSHTTVAGVSVGGLSASGAARTLREAFGPAATAPVRLHLPDSEVSLDPRAAGLALDLDTTLRGLTGVSFAPANLWRHLSGGAARPLRTSVDRHRLEAALVHLARSVDRPAREGSISFAQGTASSTPSRPGQRLQVAATADAVARAWPQRSAIPVSVAVTRPRLPATAVTAALHRFAQPAMSGPLTLRVGKDSVRLTPVQFGPALSMKADAKGVLRPVVDGTKLVALLREVVPQAERAPVDAQVRLVKGHRQVIPAIVGRRLDPVGTARAALPALTSASRTATAAIVDDAPQLTTGQAKVLGAAAGSTG